LFRHFFEEFPRRLMRSLIAVKRDLVRQSALAARRKKALAAATSRLGDNAPMESCFGTLKTELVHPACYKTREAARHDLY
jgi:transposase InsO family protein